MDDGVDPLERAANDVRVADVARDQLDVPVQIAGPLAVAVHLGDQAVQGAHRVARAEKLVGEVRADEPAAAGDEHALGHGREVTRYVRRILGSIQA